MKISLEVVQQHLKWSDILNRVKWAEAARFDGAWVFDHFKPLQGDSAGDCLEGWSLLAGLATATKTIRLGTLVTGATYRPPSVLAAQAVTVDHISDGRLELGLGAGWFQAEHDELGLRFPPTRERIARLEEAVTVMRALMTTDHITWEGRYFHLKDATFRPRPIQQPHPPIWIGALGERVMLPLVARQADVWHASAPLGEMLRKSALLDQYAEEYGRSPSAIARAGSLRLSSSWDEVRATAQSFRVAGFSHLVVVWPDEGQDRLVEFADRLLPELQAL